MEPVDIGNLDKKLAEATNYLVDWIKYVDSLLTAFRSERGQLYGTLAYLMNKFEIDEFQISVEDLKKIAEDKEWVQFLPTEIEDTMRVKRTFEKDG